MKYTIGTVLISTLFISSCGNFYETDEEYYAKTQAKQQTSISAFNENQVSTFDLRKQSQAAKIDIVTLEVTRSYDIVKKVNVEHFLIDARSEEDAELRAFYQLILKAKNSGADAIIEIKRSVFTDGVALLNTQSTTGGRLERGTTNSTQTQLDSFTVDNYQRGVGTLSSRQIESTFDRTRYSQRSVRFTGKAINYNN